MNNRLLLLTLCLSSMLIAGNASAGECNGTHATITETGKKFSLVVPKGLDYQSFDDIGCAVESRNNECATRQDLFDRNAVAVDYLSGEEIRADAAFFVIKTGVETPKGYGIVSFKDKAEAEKFSAEHGKGKVLRWFELVDEKLN